MKTMISGLALAVALGGLSGVATAQPSGGPAAKGNAPLKAAHTVNDGTAKAGANSFTQSQAQKHIEASGFSNVSGLAKGADGVWRGQAMRGGQTVGVAMDFKGNVSTVPAAGQAEAAGGAAGAGAAGAAPASADGASASNDGAGQGSPRHHVRRRHHRHHRAARCAAAERAGAACSGVSTDQNGISDKETHGPH